MACDNYAVNPSLNMLLAGRSVLIDVHEEQHILVDDLCYLHRHSALTGSDSWQRAPAYDEPML